MIDLVKRWEEFKTPRKQVTDLQAGPLLLVAITAEMLTAEQDSGPGELARLLKARVTASWPPEHWEPHVYRFILKQVEDRPDTLGWHRYMLLTDRLGRGRTLVGAFGGFPKPEGDVEIGYSTLPEFQRRGYATAAARAMVDWLLSREGIRSVSAQTYPHLPESIKIMERCGMIFVGNGDDPDTVRYRRMGPGAVAPPESFATPPDMRE